MFGIERLGQPKPLLERATCIEQSGATLGFGCDSHQDVMNLAVPVGRNSGK